MSGTTVSMSDGREHSNAERVAFPQPLNGRGCVSVVAHTADSADSGTNDESAEHAVKRSPFELRDLRLPLGPVAPRAARDSAGAPNGYSYRRAADPTELPALRREPYERRRVFDGRVLVLDREVEAFIANTVARREVA